MRYTVCALLALAAAVPAHAERLLIDHTLYPALYAAMLKGPDNVYYATSEKPRYVLDRIKIQGESQQNWQEALEITVFPTKRKLAGPLDWLASYRSGEDATCPSQWDVSGSDAVSVTFTRSQAQCQQLSGQTRIYRAVLGQKNVFLVGGLYRGQMDATMRNHWFALLATARLAN